MSKKKKHVAPADENLFEDMDDHFTFIAGYTPGRFPYGTTWEELGIDPGLPLTEKARLYDERLMSTNSGLTTQNRATIKAISQRISEIHTTLQDMYLGTDQPELKEAMNGLEEAMISLSGLWEEPPAPEVADYDEIIEVDEADLPF